MKLLLKSIVIMSVLLLAFSCSEDDPEHYLRFATVGDSLKVNLITIDDLSFTCPASDIPYIEDNGNDGYAKITSGRNYDITYDVEFRVDRDSLRFDSTLVQPDSLTIDTVLVEYKIMLNITGQTNTSNNDFYGTNSFKAEGLNLWTLTAKREEYSGQDDRLQLTIESSLPNN